MPSTLTELGLTAQDIDTMVKKFHQHNGDTVTDVYYTITPEVSRAIYEIAHSS